MSDQWFQGEALRLREQIVELGRRMWLKGLVAANDGNLSARLPDGNILCTPTAVSKGTMTPQLLCVLSPDGEVLHRGSGAGPSSELPMHLRVYQVNPKVQAVVHAHPPYATAFAIRGEGLTKHFMPETAVLLGTVPLAPYATPSTSEVPDSVEPLVLRHRACLLEHHGALTWDVDLESAYLNMERVEHVARILAITRQLGGERELNSQQMARLRQTFDLPD